MTTLTQLYGDCRDVLPTLPAESVHLIITSPPYYGLRAYSDDPREIGREPSPDAYIANLVAVFREARRVLRGDGVLVLNLGDSYAGSPPGNAHGANSQRVGRANLGHQSSAGIPAGLKPKDKLLIPHRVALALQADGWYVRQDMCWLKRSAMPESVTDRPSVAHEYVFILAKSERYWWDAEAIRQSYNPNSTARMEYGFKSYGAEHDYGRKHGALRDGGEIAPNPAGRNYRTTDPFFASLDAEIAYHRARLAELERIRERGGLLTDDDGEPLALPVNPRPFSGAHFAVFPPTLVEPFMLAACPRQCCPACGAGWVRVVERGQSSWEARKAAGHPIRYGADGKGQQQRGGDFDNRAGGFGTPAERRDLGFRPACACPEHEPVPGVALDMFGGSGTVGQVAIAHGRRAILIELNEAYARLQDQRTDGVQVSLFDDAA